MANKFPEHKPDPCEAPAEAFRHVRKNPVTGEPEYFYPMEITDPSIRAYARAKGMEITGTRLGNRVIEAVMVPCRESGMHRGLEVPADTPPEAQRRLYLACISDELREQDARRRDGRCLIPDGRGGLKRCRPRTPNPEYTPGSVIAADIFAEGDKIDATAISKGKGFQGAIRKNGQHRGPMGHGSKFHRHQGSNGSSSSPSRVFKGKGMPGHMGSVQVTVRNLEIVRVDAEKNLILIKGAVPGPKKGMVTIKETTKVDA